MFAYDACCNKRSFSLGLFLLTCLLLDTSDESLFIKKASLAFLIASFMTYFNRPSPLIQDLIVTCPDHTVTRPVTDKIVWTSLIYGIAGLYSLSVGQYSLGTLQIVTCVGSFLYHLKKEALYFNLDNVFASSLLFLTIYAGALAYHVQDFLQIFSTIFGLPVAIFLIIYCGMPAKKAQMSGVIVRQCAGAQYDDWHTAWHFTSGIGTANVAHFFSTHWPTLQCGGPSFAAFPHLPIVPTLSLLLALSMNMIGNVTGVMPVH